MKPLFTIHTGEYLAGEYIQRSFKKVNIWVPVKDTGIDLLVSNPENTKTVSLQVKFSRDFPATDLPVLYQKSLHTCGWWTLNRDKILYSSADYWVFVLLGLDRKNPDFVVIPPKELVKRLDAIHGKISRIHTYLWVTEKQRCWETRGIRKLDKVLIAEGQYKDDDRDFSQYLNNWKSIMALNKT